jgi:PadR family transcriptional regulator PadR
MINNIKSQMRKGLLEYCILSIISRDEAYASDILDTLKQANLLVVEGTLYPLLTRMKNEELLTYRWQESTSGPPRKYYALTKEGQELLSQLHEEWETIQKAVAAINIE